MSEFYVLCESCLEENKDKLTAQAQALRDKDDEIARLKERFDFKGALTDSVAKQQERIAKLEADNTRLRAEVAELNAKINGAVNVGHNKDCMFCGFKDKALTTNIVKEQQNKQADEEL